MTRIELLTYSTLFTNDLICSNIIDVLSRIRTARFYKQKFKQKAKELDMLSRRYESIVNFELRRSQEEFADANNFIEDLVSNDIERLRLKILSHIDISPKAEIAQMMLIDVLCGISEVQYNFLLKFISRSDHVEFKFLSISSISKANEFLTESLIGGKSDIDVTEYVMPIITKLCNVETVEKIAV